MKIAERTITVALAGQPNVGKTSVFNLLTGQSEYVSNWPGKTYEHKAGSYHKNGTSLLIIDLPGAYSLTANSEEERAARDFLISGSPDVVVAVVDAATLERSLYMVAELLCLPIPIVLALNMIDIAGNEGIQVDPDILAAALGVPVIPMVARRGQGAQDLVEAVIRTAEDPGGFAPNRPLIQEDHQSVLAEIEALIAPYVPDPYPPAWVAIKLLEGDEEITHLIRPHLGDSWEKVHQILVQHDDAYLAVASGRYEWIGRMVKAAVRRPKPGQVTVTDRIDRFATHPVLGVFVLLAIIGGLFWLTYTIGAPVQTWLEVHAIHGASEWVSLVTAGAPAWLTSLLVDGVIAGVGTVLTLLPILIIFFTVLGLLEEFGYMARAAYVMDRFMHLMGLHGKSFLPLFLGFGCNVPAIAGTRILDTQKARLITILVTPLVPCTARLSVIAILAPIFFGSNALLISWGLVGLSLLVLTLLGIILHEIFLGGEHTAFIMELPLYHLPDRRIICRAVCGRTLDFLKGAGTIILVVSILMWALSTYPGENIETSYLAAAGRLLAPVGKLMGLDWQMMVALLTSFVRKENTIPTLAVLYGSGAPGAGLADVLGGQLTPTAALAFLAVTMLFIPCAATVATIKHETGSWKWTFTSILLLLFISMGIGIVLYQAARFAGWGV